MLAEQITAHLALIATIKVSFNDLNFSSSRGSNFCLLAFSSTDRKSYDHVGWWKQKVEAECGPLPMMLVMNKIDLEDSALVSR